jgi:hypothetical protein
MYTTTTMTEPPKTIPTTVVPVSVSTATTTTIPPSNSSTEDMDATIPTNSDVHLLEQVQALLQAADLLSQLAAMDTTVYQSTLSGQELGPGPPDAFRLQQSLDQIQRHWKLEDTPVPLLTRSIHRLHSGLTVLRAEADQQATEILSLQQQVTALLHNNGKLERDATRLHGKNEKLVMQLLHSKKEKRSLIGHVKDLFGKIRDSEQNRKELQEFNVLYKLQAHEQILLMQQTTNPRGRSDSNFSDADPRERSDSNFSNADALDFNSNTDDDDSSISSSVSSALVRDDSFGLGIGRIAALKLAIGTTDTERTLSTAATRSTASEDSSDSFSWWSGGSRTVVLSDPAAPYTLTFLRCTKIGLKIRAVPLDDAPKLPVHKGLLNDAILQGDKEHAVDGPTKPKETKKGFSLGFNLDSLLGKTPNAASEKRTAGEAKLGVAPGELGRIFVVSGYNDFDTDLNAKPAVGTRIIAIDGHVIDNVCTMETLTERLEECSGKRDADETGNCCTTFSVCFQNNPLTKKQRDWLGLPPKGPTIEVGTARELNEKDEAQPTLDNTGESMPKEDEAKATRLPGLFPFLKSNNGSTPPVTGSAEECVDDRVDAPITPPDQGFDKKGISSIPVPTNETIGDSKARGGSGVFPFWNMGHATALKESAGEKESINNEKSGEFGDPPAATTLTEESKAIGMMSFWKMGNSSAVVEKNRHLKTSNLKDSVDKPSNDQLDAESSTLDGANHETQVDTEEQLSQGAVENESTTNEKGDERDVPPATTTLTEESKATGMMSFWKMGSSSAVVEKNRHLKTSNLKDSVDKPSNDQLDAESSSLDCANHETQVGTEEQLSQGAVENESTTNEKGDECEVPSATTTTTTTEEEKSKVNSAVDEPQKPEEQAAVRIGMMSFWKMGSSRTIVGKNGQPITSDLKDGVGTPSGDQLDADLSTLDGNNHETQVDTEEQLSVNKDADASD